MTRFTRTRLATQVAFALGAWAMSGVGGAIAQTAPAAKPDSGEIQSVTVTANRRAEDQQ